ARDKAHDTGGGVAKGAATGGGLGAGAGLLTGLGLPPIPGIGPGVAAGWLGATVIGAATGPGPRGAGRGLVGALTHPGGPEEGTVYGEGFGGGGRLRPIGAPDPRASEFKRALARSRPTDTRARGKEYRSGGWPRFDPSAPPPP